MKLSPRFVGRYFRTGFCFFLSFLFSFFFFLLFLSQTFSRPQFALDLKTRPVTVYKLVTAGTVDAQILEMGKRKTEVTAALLDEQATDPKAEAQSMSMMLKDALRSFLS